MESTQRRRHRELIDQVPSMIWRSDVDVRCIYVNAEWLSFTGRSLEQELGAGWSEGIHPHDVKSYLETFRAHVAQRKSFRGNFRLRRFDGIYRNLSIRAVSQTDEEGNFTGFLASCVDLEDITEEELPSVADSLFEMVLDGVCIAGFDGYFKRVNPSWVRTLGWTVEELMAKPIVEFAHPDDRSTVLTKQQELYRGGVLRDLVNRYRCKDGSYRWFQWKSVSHPERELIYAVARDITAQKQADEELREAQKSQKELQRQLIFADRMASVGTLAAGVAHEINNPLTYVTTNLALMLQKLDSHDPSSPDALATIGEMAKEARAGAERIRKIVSGLKTFSRSEEEHRAIIDVIPVLEMSISMTSNEIRHRATLIRELNEIPTVEADESRLGQVLINLLVNAAQALPEGDTTDQEIRVRTSTDEEGRAVIEVQDTGCGISPELIERIFDPFFTTKPIGVGTGLGLPICHTIITNMGGELTLTSTEGKGSTARITLPATTGAVPTAVARPDRKETPPPPAPQPATRATILVIDDEPAIGRALRRILFDHDVTAVTSAREALTLLDTGADYHIIFSDLMMPEMSGMDFYDELTRRHPTNTDRVVFISGGAFTPKARAFLDEVPNERLEKPFDLPVIEEIVERYLNRSTSMMS